MERLYEYSNQPFMLLEGGQGLNEKERYIYRTLVSKSMDVWSIDNLYGKVARLGAINFLRPKTLIFGTTGAYKKDLELIQDFATALDFSSVEKVILTLDTENTMGKFLHFMGKEYPKIKFYKLKHFFTCDEDVDVMIKEIKL
jgi:hypothetical protein